MEESANVTYIVMPSCAPETTTEAESGDSAPEANEGTKTQYLLLTDGTLLPIVIKDQTTVDGLSNQETTQSPRTVTRYIVRSRPTNPTTVPVSVKGPVTREASGGKSAIAPPKFCATSLLTGKTVYQANRREDRQATGSRQTTPTKKSANQYVMQDEVLDLDLRLRIRGQGKTGLSKEVTAVEDRPIDLNFDADAAVSIEDDKSMIELPLDSDDNEVQDLDTKTTKVEKHEDIEIDSAGDIAVDSQHAESTTRVSGKGTQIIQDSNTKGKVIQVEQKRKSASDSDKTWWKQEKKTAEIESQEITETVEPEVDEDFEEEMDPIHDEIQDEVELSESEDLHDDLEVDESPGEDECGRKFQCNEEGCGLVFQRFKGLLSHERNVHLCLKTPMERVTLEVNHSDDFKYECPVCEERCSQKQMLNDHIRFDHKDYRHKTVQFTIVKIGTKCQFCSKTFEDNLNLKYHEAEHTKNRATTSTDGLGIALDQNVNGAKVKKTPGRKRLAATAHIQKTKDGTEKFKCPHCPLTCYSVHNVQRHISRKHSNAVQPSTGEIGLVDSALNKPDDSTSIVDHEFQHVCGTCNENFSTLDQLIQHIDNHETHDKENAQSEKAVREEKDEKRFSCQDCDKSFGSQVALRGHMKCHKIKKIQVSSTDKNDYEVDKKFPCPHCPATFKTQPTLKRHIRNHSDDEKLTVYEHERAGKEKPEETDTQKDFDDTGVESSVNISDNDNEWSSDEIRKSTRLTRRGVMYYSQYICIKCGVQIKNKSAFYRHSLNCMIDIETPALNTKIMCNSCSSKLTFENILLFANHVELVHNTDNYESFTDQDISVDLSAIREAPLPEKYYQKSDKDVDSTSIYGCCIKCGQEIHSQTWYGEHLLNCMPDLAPTLKKALSCNECNASKFKSVITFLNHVLLKHGSTAYQSYTETDITLDLFTIADCLQESETAMLVFELGNPDVSSESMNECSDCSATFLHSKTLHFHIKAIHAKIQCRICNKDLQNRIELDNHMSTVHTSKENKKCEICGKVLPSVKGKMTHVRVYHGDIISGENQCLFCGIESHKYDSLYEVINHLKEMHAEQMDQSDDFPTLLPRQKPDTQKNKENTLGQKPLKLYCEICDLVFATNKNVKNHYRLKHPGQTPDVLEGVLEQKTEERYTCDLCWDKRTFKARKILYRHFRNFHPDKASSLIGEEKEKAQIELRGRKVRVRKRQLNDRLQKMKELGLRGGDLTDEDEVSGNEDMEWSPGQEKPCINCGKLFSQKSSIVQHALKCYYKPGRKVEQSGISNTDETQRDSSHTPMETDVQTENETTESVKENEEKNTPEKKDEDDNEDTDQVNKREATCGLCGVLFATPFNCREHIRKVHMEPVLRFTCPDCQLLFSSEDQLRWHTDGTCRGEMKEGNYNTSEKVSAEQSRIMCGSCGKILQNKQKLAVHLKSNHGNRAINVCSLCGHDFESNSEMRIHYDSHPDTERKKFLCSRCGARFLSKVQLQKHEAKFCDTVVACSLCDSLLSSQKNLEKHMATVHADGVVRRQHRRKKHVKYTAEPCSIPMRNAIRVRFACKVCDKRCSNQQELEEHQKASHSPEEILKPYPCDQCGKRFRVHKFLLYHKLIHTGEKPYRCKICDKAFHHPGELRRHNRIHLDVMPYKCSVCDKQFHRLDYLKHHLVSHQRTKYPCTVCKQEFWQPESLEEHMRTHTGERPFRCDECGERYMRQTNLDKHIAQYHPHLRTTDDEGQFKCEEPNCGETFNCYSTLASHRLKHSGKQPHQCKTCNKTFLYKGALTVHMRSHTGERPYECRICNKGFKDSGTLRQHERRHDANNETRVCNICGKSMDKKNIKIHMRKHLGIRPFTCDREGCGKTYTSTAELNQHKKSHEGQIKRYECEECGLMMRDKTMWRHHMMIHTGEKPETCPECGKVFRLKSELRRHMLNHSDPQIKCAYCPKLYRTNAEMKHHIMTHTGEKPYRCNICGISYRRSQQLRIHSLNHTGERPHICKDCGAGHKTGYELRLHQRRKHGGDFKRFGCPVCEKDFVSAWQLTKHLKACHVGETPYECEYCSKAFLTNSEKCIHERAHTGDMKYECDQCDNRFKSKAERDTHISTYHVEVQLFACQFCDQAFYTSAELREHAQSHITFQDGQIHILGVQYTEVAQEQLVDNGDSEYTNPSGQETDDD